MDNLSYHNMGYVCSHVYEASRPVLLVSRMDGDWQFLCGLDDHDDETPHVVGIGHLIERDASLKEVLTMEEDWEAERNNINTAWNYSECNPKDYE